MSTFRQWIGENEEKHNIVVKINPSKKGRSSSIPEEIKSIFNSENAGYHTVQSFLLKM
jgi:hypothetical protein